MTHPDQTVRVPREPDAGLMSVISAMVRRIAVAVSVEDDEVYFDNGHARQIYKAITDAAPSPEAEGAGEREAIERLTAMAAFWDSADALACEPQNYEPGTGAENGAFSADLRKVLASLQRPQTTAHPCYGEHQPGCDCVTTPQPEQVKPSYLDRLAQTTAPDSGLVDRLVEALERVEYKPGDHPIVPIKHAAFVAEIKSIAAQARKGAA